MKYQAAIFRKRYRRSISNFSGCAIDPEDETKHWCSTKVDSNGNHLIEKNEYGYCSNNCPIHNGISINLYFYMQVI